MPSEEYVSKLRTLARFLQGGLQDEEWEKVIWVRGVLEAALMSGISPQEVYDLGVKWYGDKMPPQWKVFPLPQPAKPPDET